MLIKPNIKILPENKQIVWTLVTVLNIHIVVDQEPQLSFLPSSMFAIFASLETLPRLVNFQIVQDEFGHVCFVQEIYSLLDFQNIHFLPLYLLQQNIFMQMLKSVLTIRSQINLINVSHVLLPQTGRFVFSQ